MSKPFPAGKRWHVATPSWPQYGHRQGWHGATEDVVTDHSMPPLTSLEVVGISGLQVRVAPQGFHRSAQVLRGHNERRV